MTKEAYYKENNMKTLREHWISVDECPSCKSNNTFHSEWMNDKDLQGKSTINIYRLTTAKTRKNDVSIDPYEQVFCKEDLCLECGHTWVMYVEVVKVNPPRFNNYKIEEE